MWDVAFSGMLVIIAVWGMYYVQFVAFPSWTWPFFQDVSRDLIWIGLLVLGAVLSAYIWTMWRVVRAIKRQVISSRSGYAEHRFFMPVDPKVYAWYAFLYLLGVGILYGMFAWISGGIHLMSVPFIISPAAILVGIGWFYQLRRYLWNAAVGFTTALLLEIIATTQANYQLGPNNFLDILPQWGSPALPCLVWAAMFLASGVLGLIGVRRQANES